MGGFDRIYDCVGSTETLNEAFSLSPVWMKGLSFVGNLGYGVEDYRGRPEHTFYMVVDLMKEGKLDITDRITHRFTLDQYIEAVQVNMHKGVHNAIKTIFDLSNE